jgi:uncharacterized protein YggU (UPF0235/DUF167 family)
MTLKANWMSRQTFNLEIEGSNPSSVTTKRNIFMTPMSTNMNGYSILSWCDNKVCGNSIQINVREAPIKGGANWAIIKRAVEDMKYQTKGVYLCNSCSQRFQQFLQSQGKG